MNRKVQIEKGKKRKYKPKQKREIDGQIGKSKKKGDKMKVQIEVGKIRLAEKSHSYDHNVKSRSKMK